MTVIAAIAHEGNVVMSCDTLTQYAGSPLLGAVKVVRLPVAGWVGSTPEAGEDPGGEALMAFAGDGALVSLARRRLSLVAPQGGQSVHHWAEDVAVALTEAADSTTPALTETQDSQGRLPGAALLAFRGQLFYLFTHQAVSVPADAHGYAVAALGSGYDVAVGAMHAGLKHEADITGVAVAAVHLACRFVDSCGVGPDGAPVHVLAACD